MKKGYPKYKIHGMAGTSTYNTWIAMKARCDKETDKEYKNYGCRGISYCKEWSKFQNFYADMGERPKGLQLDRIDNDGNYCKENCRWIAPNINVANTRVKAKSKLKGVYKQGNKYLAAITINRKFITIGRFFCPVLAAAAFENKHKEVYGF